MVLRPLEIEDLNTFNESRARRLPPQNRFDQKKQEPITLKEFKKIVREHHKMISAGEGYPFVIFNKGKQVIGGVGISSILRGGYYSANVGYGIVNNHWGKGYCKEALTAVIKFAFTKLNLHRLEALIVPGNIRSMRLAKSVGFRKEGFSRKRCFDGEKWIDFVVYAITCEDIGIKWQKPRDKKRGTV